MALFSYTSTTSLYSNISRLSLYANTLSPILISSIAFKPRFVITNVPPIKQNFGFIAPDTAPPIAPHMKPSAAPSIAPDTAPFNAPSQVPVLMPSVMAPVTAPVIAPDTAPINAPFAAPTIIDKATQALPPVATHTAAAIPHAAITANPIHTLVAQLGQLPFSSA